MVLQEFTDHQDKELLNFVIRTIEYYCQRKSGISVDAYRVFGMKRRLSYVEAFWMHYSSGQRVVSKSTDALGYEQSRDLYGNRIIHEIDYLAARDLLWMQLIAQYDNVKKLYAAKDCSPEIDKCYQNACRAFLQFLGDPRIYKHRFGKMSLHETWNTYGIAGNWGMSLTELMNE